MIQEKVNNFGNSFPLGFMLCFIMLTLIFSCDNQQGSDKPYDPSLPVTVSTFFPDSGGMASKVIIQGSNFGNNVDDVKVYFNQKQAAVISSKSDIMYVLVPRQPGDICEVSVVIGTDSVVVDQTFRYKTSVVVTTVASKPNSLGDDDYIYDGTLAEVAYGWIDYLVVDKENNLFINQSWPPRIIFINEEQNRSTVAYGPHPVTWWQSFSQPTIDSEGSVVYFPDEGNDWNGPNRENFYVLDPGSQWAASVRQMIHPSEADQAAGVKDFYVTNKDAFAYNPSDGSIWTRSRESGQMIRFHAKTRKGEAIENGIMPGSEGKLLFHPTEKNMLYIAYTNRNCIFTYNVETHAHTLFAGKQGVQGWRDGTRLEAEFNYPEQITFDAEGNLYVADANNHVIRKIATNGLVSTVIGIGGTAGYQDGSPEEALLNTPSGIAVNLDGDIYIGDNGNKCIRKLSIQ
ncbi:MAG: IPT/TIG domain-containing protein [Dysgonamonadaceae bacterium]|jgi:sugar lactone lactonase YvrE|nr:IPT/TIG domain-containing protein [Dysgonamonadaceae bacterium]